GPEVARRRSGDRRGPRRRIASRQSRSHARPGDRAPAELAAAAGRARSAWRDALHSSAMPRTFAPPSNLEPISALLPSCPVLLMGAGPVPISRQVSDANRVVINHLGQSMTRVVDSVKQLASYALQTESARVL